MNPRHIPYLERVARALKAAANGCVRSRNRDTLPADVDLELVMLRARLESLRQSVFRLENLSRQHRATLREAVREGRKGEAI